MKRSTVTGDIRRRFCLLYFIIIFVIVSLLLLNIRHLYKPAAEIFNFLPELSIAVIIISNLALSIAGFYLFAILSKQVLKKIEDYSGRLSSILTIMKNIRKEVHIDLLLEKILDYCISLTRSDVGVLLINDNGNLVVKNLKGQGTYDLREKIGIDTNGICLWTLKKGEPIVVNDITTDERFNRDVDLAGTKNIGSILCVPLRTEKKAFRSD